MCYTVALMGILIVYTVTTRVRCVRIKNYDGKYVRTPLNPVPTLPTVAKLPKTNEFL